LQRRKRLTGGVAGTLMSNLAFEHALEAINIPFARAKVGDRYVMELLQQREWRVGGENSGHILCLDQHSTGDGAIAALQVLRALRETGMTLKKACAPVKLFPQVMINVPLKQRTGKGARCRCLAPPPHLLQQKAAGQQLARVGQQQHCQIVSLGRQRQALAIAENQPVARVDTQRAQFDHIFMAGFTVNAAPRKRRHPRQQFQ